MHKVLLGLGSNIGNRDLFLSSARMLIGKWIGEISQASSIHQTLAWGEEDQPAFLNQVIEVKTLTAAPEVLELTQQIEYILGRQKRAKWREREIDIDILFYDDSIVNTSSLKIPHPFISTRAFVLKPLLEICPNFEHPVLHKSIQTLHDELMENQN